MRSKTHTPTPDVDGLKEQLAAVLQHLAEVKEAVEASNATSFTIAEFCARHRLSESQYHKLRREGRTPRTMSTGSVAVRISREAEREWIAEREREALAAQQRVEQTERAATMDT